MVSNSCATMFTAVDQNRQNQSLPFDEAVYFDQFLMETLEEANMRGVQSVCNLQPEYWMPLILVLKEAETVGVI